MTRVEGVPELVFSPSNWCCSRSLGSWRARRSRWGADGFSWPEKTSFSVLTQIFHVRHLLFEVAFFFEKLDFGLTAHTVDLECSSPEMPRGRLLSLLSPSWRLVDCPTPLWQPDHFSLVHSQLRRENVFFVRGGDPVARGSRVLYSRQLSSP